jgi:hypothetical protein
LQLLFAFIILSIITLSALLLILLNKNSRSAKVCELALQYDWQYQEFVNFSDTIKAANFGLLNYSQNAIFRHVISADEQYFGLGFNFFDCRAIEPSGIHNSSVILFNLILPDEFSDLHASISPLEKGNSSTKEAMQSPIDQTYLTRLRKMQKLSILAPHYAFENYQLHANSPTLFNHLLEQHLSQKTDETNLSTWLLAHPHLHIEISNGILLAYQPNRLLDDEMIMIAIEAVADISKQLSN